FLRRKETDIFYFLRNIYPNDLSKHLQCRGRYRQFCSRLAVLFCQSKVYRFEGWFLVRSKPHRHWQRQTECSRCIRRICFSWKRCRLVLSSHLHMLLQSCFSNKQRLGRTTFPRLREQCKLVRFRLWCKLLHREILGVILNNQIGYQLSVFLVRKDLFRRKTAK